MCRTLFEKDKLLFSFNITIKLQIYNGDIDPTHFRYFLTGYTDDVQYDCPCPSWIDKMSWQHIYKDIHGLDTVKGFEGFRDYFVNNLEKFEMIYTNEDPRKVSFPSDWEEKLDMFQKMIIYKALRPD